MLHTLIGMGSAALAAAVPYPVKTIRISREGQRSTLYIYMAIGLNCSLWHHVARFGRCTLAFDLAVVVLQ